VAALVTAAVAGWLVGVPVLAGESFSARIIRLAVIATAGAATYVGLLHLLRLPEAAEALRAVTRRRGAGEPG
jgi:hypothetical protein